MRLTLDEALSQQDPEIARTLKRIDRDVPDDLTGSLAVIAVADEVSVEEAVAQVAKKAGLLGKPAREVNREEARDVLVGIIARDLAYRALRQGPATADATAQAFLDLFGEDARFFTNGELGLSHKLGRTGAWLPLTRATFDTGLVAVGAGKAGVFWVEDEN